MKIDNEKNNVNMYSYLIGNSSDSKYKNEQLSNGSEEPKVSFEDILSNLTGQKTKIKSYMDYSPVRTFDQSTSNIYQDFMTKGISVAKVYTTAQYQKLLKDAEEFEKLIRKLVEEANRNNQGAIEALKMLNTMFKEFEGSKKTKEEVFADLFSKVKDFVKSFDYNNSTGNQKSMLDVLTFSLTAASKENSVDKMFSHSSLYKKFEDDKAENSYLSTMFSKIKQKKRYEPAKTTKTYIKEKKVEEEIDSKVQKITDLRYAQDKVSARNEINRLINDISTMGMDDLGNSKLFILDPTKMNRVIQSPMFA